jgi:uncharacterized membrane protein
MEDIQSTLQALRLHPVADHFTVALVAVAVLADLCASLFSQRAWFRHMALTLTLLAAVSAAASDYSGTLEAQRVKDTLTGPAKTLLHSHAELGEFLTYVVCGLAVVRVALALFGFLARLRPLYLILALATVAAVFWQGHWGGELVYTYGVGTDLAAASAPRVTPAPAGVSSGPLRVAPTPRIETPMARATPQAAPLSPLPTSAPSAPKAAGTTSVTPAAPARVSTPVPAPSARAEMTTHAAPTSTPPASPSPSTGGFTQSASATATPSALGSPLTSHGANSH